MARTVTVVFDGEVFRPIQPLDLLPGASYQVTIEEQPNEEVTTLMPRTVRRALERARHMDLPIDLAAQHDHYLYGTPKR